MLFIAIFPVTEGINSNTQQLNVLAGLTAPIGAIVTVVIGFVSACGVSHNSVKMSPVNLDFLTP